jgi:arylformamidase
MDLSRDYANGAHIAGAGSFPPKWQREAAAFRAGLGGRAKLGLPYGPGARQGLDLFYPLGPARGLMVFVHGGYWLDFGRESWSHLAAGALARGWACAVISYTLAPAARIAEITQDVAQAVRTAADQIAGPVVVTGHSAGGHLCARMGCADLGVNRVARVVPISAVADLAPLMQTAMNADLKIDAAEVVRESPSRLKLRHDCEAHVWVGDQERPAFLWQARTLSEEWGCRWTVAPGRHHFDVIDDLADPGSSLMEACLGQL